MEDMQSRFRHGESILYRELDEHGRIVDTKPVVVVEDSDAQVVLWLPLDTPTKKPVLLNHTPGTPRRWEEGNWELIDGVWRWAEILIIVRPDDFRATWVRWSADRIFEGCYVNMQSKLTRTPLGFDLTDHQLDIVVEPDRNWRWKDQDEQSEEKDNERLKSGALIRC
jgi:hypothetical protein